MEDWYEYLYGPDTLTPAEARLQDDYFWGLDYHGTNPDDYFREGHALIRTVDQPEKVRKVLESYLRHAKDPGLREELEQVLVVVRKSSPCEPQPIEVPR